MSDQDIRDLWSSVNEVREAQGLTNTRLAEIKAMLGERCSTREMRMERLEENQKEQGRKHDELESEIAEALKVQSTRIGSLEVRMAFYAGAGAVLGALGSQLIGGLVKAVMQ